VYTLNVLVSQNGVLTPYTASATLPVAPRVLGTWASAPSCSRNTDGSGSCTLPAAPAFVTETLVVAENTCFGFDSEVASVETTTTTPTTVSFPVGTFALTCSDFTTSASYQAFAVGADYPLVESGPPTNTQQTPTIAGSTGTANLTFSDFGNTFP
jgi:hypothetical protein